MHRKPSNSSLKAVHEFFAAVYAVFHPSEFEASIGKLLRLHSFREPFLIFCTGLCSGNDLCAAKLHRQSIECQFRLGEEMALRFKIADSNESILKIWDISPTYYVCVLSTRC